MAQRTRQIIWTDRPPQAQRLRREGFLVLRHERLRKKIRKCQATGSRRSTLENPADKILAQYRRYPRVAILGVRLHRESDFHQLYGYVVEPAFRLGCTLLIGAEISEDQIVAAAFPGEPFWGFDWSRERLLHLLNLGRSPASVEVPDPVPRWRRWWSRLSRSGNGSENCERLDLQQMSAVRAGDGVVQVIAPAGSGKTTVLVRRVQELRHRGTSSGNILCLSFNRNAKEEMAERLDRAGLSGVVVRSFHGMGREILRQEGQLRTHLGELPEAELQILLDRTSPVADASAERLSCAAARHLISGFKLASMLPPEDAGHPLYSAYENELRRRSQLDFDDLIARSVRLLQSDVEVRRRWQKRFHRILVDEYQDIEPAQALLVGILAAPQDSLFCVGDEDQCIYAWRRATVKRIIELDQVYPGLERHALARNYRCGSRITKASRRLVQHNQVRFRKPLQVGSSNRGSITAISTPGRSAAARLLAWALSDAEPGATAVLARTDRLLREVRFACDQHGVSLDEIELATIHGAEGGEWPRVILYGVDEGQIPHAVSLKTGELEAERRLFYVALTRAQERLEIVCTRGRASRFLGEAGIRVRAG